MRIVIALGGNALLRRGDTHDIGVQRENVRVACEAIAPLVADHTIILTHGNGPQVGLLALQGATRDELNTFPLDVLGAQSDGMIGYMIEQELLSTIPRSRVANLLTETLIDIEDPAFQNPTKFIGPSYSEAEAKHISRDSGWIFKADGKLFRRVVPSPNPKEILAEAAIVSLSDAGFLVICTGGGGVPVERLPSGRLRGVEAVIDKDRASALLATRVNADALLLLTDVEAVFAGWGTASQKPINQTTVSELRRQDFAAGSMRPKVEAVCDFVEQTGKFAGIGALQDAVAILKGTKGTTLGASEAER